MTVYQEEIVEQIAGKLDMDTAEVRENLNQLVERIHRQTDQGEIYDVEGFGSFYKKEEGALEFDPTEGLETEINYKYAGMEPVELAGSNKDLSEEDEDIKMEDDSEEDAEEDINEVFGVGDEQESDEDLTSPEDVLNDFESREAETEEIGDAHEEQPEKAEDDKESENENAGDDQELEDSLLDEVLEEEKREEQDEVEEDMSEADEDEHEQEGTEEQAAKSKDPFRGIEGMEGGEPDETGSEEKDSPDIESELEEKSLDDMIDAVDDETQEWGEEWEEEEFKDLEEEAEAEDTEEREKEYDSEEVTREQPELAEANTEEALKKDKESPASGEARTEKNQKGRRSSSRYGISTRIKSFFRNINESFPVVPLLLVSVSVFVLGFGFWMIMSPELRQNVYEFTDDLIHSEQQIEQRQRRMGGNETADGNNSKAAAGGDKTASKNQQTAKQSSPAAESAENEESENGEEGTGRVEEEEAQDEASQQAGPENENRYGLKGSWFAEEDGTSYTLIIYSFTDRSNAREMSAKVKKDGYRSTIDRAVIDGTTYYRIAIGQFKSIGEAQSAAEKLKKPYRENFFVRRISNS